MSDREDVIRASADALRNAVESGDRRQIMLTARDHAATMLQWSTSARDTPALLTQIRDLTDSLAALDAGDEPDKFAELLAGVEW